MCESIVSWYDYILYAGAFYFVVIGMLTSVSANGKFSLRALFRDARDTFGSDKEEQIKYVPRVSVQSLLEKVYVDLVPMHVNFVAKSITNEEVSRHYLRSGKFNGRPISYMSLGPDVFRFKFYTKTGPVYTDCFSETFSGALLKLIALINQMDKIPAVFKEEPNNECGTDPS